jgi:ArsR family transcriptional regulator
LSQHLALLREGDIVATRRESQMIYYRVADHAAMRIIETLAELFCPPEMRTHK